MKSRKLSIKTGSFASFDNHRRRTMKDYRIKYRPSQLSDLWGNEKIKSVWQRMVGNKSFPKGIILNGPIGTGKTSLARIMAEDIIRNGDEDCLLTPKELFKEINSPLYDYSSAYRLVNQFQDIDHGSFVLFFDEAQRIQDKTLNGLMKPMEDADNFYFIFAVTNLDEIDEGIKSRSTIFNLQRPSSDTLLKELKSIAEKEGIQITDKALSKLILKAHRSPRGCLGSLFLFANHKGKIDEQVVEEYV
jgi:DNA polymerase-3 subunit gamma/tau